MSKLKVFLGGTCNNSTWRDELISLLFIDYYNPVVPNWTPECQEEEIKQREICDYCLYVITPKMTGVYSIAEVVDDSNKRPNKTLLLVLPQDGDRSFTDEQLRSLQSVVQLVKNNGAITFLKLEHVAQHLNDLSLRKEYNEYFIKAMEVLTESMRKTPTNAWTWHSALAMTFYASGVEEKAANIGAARILKVLFDVDTTKHPQYLAILSR